MESDQHREPWNKGKLVGQKPPLKPKDIWAIRIYLQSAHQVRDLAMFADPPELSFKWPLHCESGRIAYAYNSDITAAQDIRFERPVWAAK